MEFRVVNETGRRQIAAPWLKILKIAESAQKKATVSASRSARQGISVALVFISRQKIKRLNKLYRRKNQATDVLSFSAGKQVFYKGSGDILICPDFLKQHYPLINLKELVIHRFIHGLLHLHGFDHRTNREAVKMEKEVQKILAKYNYGRHHAKQHKK